MNITLIAIIIIALSLSNKTFSSQSSNDTLWNKAVMISKDNSQWIVGKTISHEMVNEEKGDIVERKELHLKYYLKENNIEVILVKSMEDRRDVTNKELSHFENNKES